jgi:DMSO/TMAO reductase YedYZ molybdopterin-dependent catalytic subunit
VNSRWQTLISGYLAGAVALALLLAWRLVTARPGFLEAVSDGFLRFVPLEAFDLGIETFGPLAKGLLYAGICGAVTVGGALFGLAARRVRSGFGPLIDGLLVALAAFLVSGLVVLPVFQAGFFGSGLGSEPASMHLPLALASLGYGLVFVGLRDGWSAGRAAVPTALAAAGDPVAAGDPAAAVRTDPVAAGDADIAPQAPLASDTAMALAPAQVEPRGVPRRTFLGRTLAIVGLGALGGSIVAVADHVLRAGRPLSAAAPPPTSPGTPADPFGPTPAITPVDTFYQVSKNLLPTQVDGAAWRLRIDGLVDRPRDWTLDEISSLPWVEAPRTLECISLNIVEGQRLIGNQTWRGVPVKALLDDAGVRPAATHVLWEAADGYTESLPLDVALHDDTWIAYLMGGAPLTAEHGYPARVMIPGRFGMKQPKWVTRLQLSDQDDLV